MDPNILIALLAMLLFIMFFSLLNSFLTSANTVQKRVWSVEAPKVPQWGLIAGVERLLKPLGKALPRSPDDLSKEQKRLVRAGFRSGDAVYLFFGARVMVAFGALIILGFTGMPRGNFLLFIILPVLLGALLPDLWLSRRIKSRQLRIQFALPDMTDLTVICVEAGMGLDQAMIRVSSELADTHRDLAEELRLYSLEVQAGLQRIKAFRNLADRTGVADLKALTVTLIQADRFGTSIADTLRVFSDTLRTKRRQRAEESAAKMSVKLIFPLLLFIFPAIFIVVAGPAVIAIIRTLLPTLAGE